MLLEVKCGSVFHLRLLNSFCAPADKSFKSKLAAAVFTYYETNKVIKGQVR